MGLSILDCPFKLPRKNEYRGHPFYYSILKIHEKIAEIGCQEIENILSVPIWYNRHLKTKFDTEISLAGFNFIKDLFPCNKQTQDFMGLTGYKRRKLKFILENVPLNWKNSIVSSENCNVTVYPNLRTIYKGEDRIIKYLRGNQIYKLLINNKVKLPTGLLRWREDVYLSDNL